jgi:hypothetical protein
LLTTFWSPRRRGFQEYVFSTLYPLDVHAIGLELSLK